MKVLVFEMRGGVMKVLVFEMRGGVMKVLVFEMGEGVMKVLVFEFCFFFFLRRVRRLCCAEGHDDAVFGESKPEADTTPPAPPSVAG